MFERVYDQLLLAINFLLGLFLLRFRRPNMERPYRVNGYPVLPALYLLLASFIEVQLLRYKPQYTWPGLILILSGVPVYWLWRKSQSARLRRNHELQS